MRNEPPSTDANATPAPVAITGEGTEDRTQFDELERLAAENRELQNTLRMNTARSAAISELREQGAHSPDLIFEAFGSKIEFDDADKAVNLADLVREIKRNHPEQFEIKETRSIDAGANGNRSAAAITAEDLRRMSVAEIARLDWAEVRRVLANN